MKETFAVIGNIQADEDRFLITFELESEQARTITDLKELAKKAAKKYAMTDEGQGAYAVNGDSFTWANFIENANDDEFLRTCRDLGLTVTPINMIASG